MTELSNYLQSYVVPVCLYRDEDGIADLRKAVGTAFFVGRSGFYLTARHVLEQAFAETKATDLRVGLNVKADRGRSVENRVVAVELYENAPQPFDVAVGLSNYIPETPIRIGHFEPTVWQEVATMGYPASTHVMENEALWINMRAHRGYVQRPTIPRDMHVGSHPNGFELSFLLSPGMSGCPIFKVDDETLIGVGVGSYRSEMVEEQFTEIQDGGQTYTEQRVRIEQYGFAHDIRELHSWKAGIFGGMTLLEIADI
ncbi:trypsin-like peptidase domain-containing protein [Rhizobium ruizarguesonis]